MVNKRGIACDWYCWFYVSMQYGTTRYIVQHVVESKSYQDMLLCIMWNIELPAIACRKYLASIMLLLAVRRTSQTSLLGPYDPTVASWTMPTRGGGAAEQGASSGHDAENWAAQMR